VVDASARLGLAVYVVDDRKKERAVESDGHLDRQDRRLWRVARAHRGGPGLRHPTAAVPPDGRPPQLLRRVVRYGRASAGVVENLSGAGGTTMGLRPLNSWQDRTITVGTGTGIKKLPTTMTLLFYERVG
jgi:hypothetical protein